MASLERFLPILIFSALAVLSVFLTRQNIQNGDVSTIAQEFKLNAVKARGLLQSQQDQSDLRNPVRSCRASLLRNELIVRMNEMDFFFGREEIRQTNERLESSSLFLKNFVTCLPMEGNALALDALVTSAMRHEDKSIYKMLSLSQFYAPVQSKIVELRVSMISGMNWHNDRDLDIILDRDIMLMALYFNSVELKKYMKIAPKDVLERIWHFSLEASPERRDELRRLF